MEIVLILLGVIALLIFILIGIYNNLVAKRQTCNQAFADIDVQLKQRWDLIPNLVQTVKGYASHEKETLEAVIAARSAATSATSVGEKSAAEGILSGALGKLFALAEAYPDLKANTNFLDLQDELSMIEDKLAAARRFYNAATGDYNTAREQFPAVIIANSFGFEEREFFDLGDEGRATHSTAPEVNF